MSKPSMAREVALMSPSTVDVLLGGPPVVADDFDRDMYELRKLADQIVAAIAAGIEVQFAYDGAAAEPVDVATPHIEFTLPMPNWDEA